MTAPNYRRSVSSEFAQEDSIGKSTGISGESRISFNFPHAVTFGMKEPCLGLNERDVIAKHPALSDFMD